MTFAFIDASENISRLYENPGRNKQLVAVVEDPFDVIALENTGQFKGTYHVLGGAISPIDGVTPEQLHIPELIERLKNDKVGEVILATNASVEGESTALYIQKQLEEASLGEIKVTRLARGLPVGVDLEYADQITLTHALQGRKEL
jgi:recombination protein RecR